jgi:hypothetical protein
MLSLVDGSMVRFGCGLSVGWRLVSCVLRIGCGLAIVLMWVEDIGLWNKMGNVGTVSIF